MLSSVLFKLVAYVTNTAYVVYMYIYWFTCICKIIVSLDPDDEKLLEEEPVNLPDKKRYLDTDMYFRMVGSYTQVESRIWCIYMYLKHVLI